MAAQSDNQTGRAGATGSPGENTCSQSNCHTGFTDNSQGGSIVISTDIPNDLYAPGVTYNMSVTVSEQGINLFGIGFEALNASGESVGLLTPGVDTQIKNATINGNLRKNIVHTQNGGAAANSKTFNFAWTSPSTDEGIVTFYAAGNAANANGGKTGDHIYSTSQSVESDGTISIREFSGHSNQLSIYPSPADHQITIKWNMTSYGIVTFEVLSLTGLTSRLLLSDTMEAGEQTESFDISTLASGNYLLVAYLNGHRHVRQFQKR